MYACPHCHSRAFGLWQVLHAPTSRMLTCANYQGRVRVRLPGKALTLAPLVLAQLVGLALGRAGDRLVLDATIVAVMFSWLFLLIWHGVTLVAAPPTPDSV